MKPFCLVAVLLLTALCGLPALAQGSFVNLDFEAATLSPISHGFEPVADALPGWSVVYGTNLVTLISINGYQSAGKSGVILYDMSLVPFPLFGRYFAGFVRDGLDPIDVSMFQTGTVPSDALSLRFYVNGGVPWIAGDMEVRLNNTHLSLQNLGLISGNYLISADVSSFAGQIAELRFTSVARRPEGGIQTFMDNIGFSPLPVPEPSIVALLMLGSGGLFLASWRRRKGK